MMSVLLGRFYFRSSKVSRGKLCLLLSQDCYWTFQEARDHGCDEMEGWEERMGRSRTTDPRTVVSCKNGVSET